MRGAALRQLGHDPIALALAERHTAPDFVERAPASAAESGSRIDRAHLGAGGNDGHLKPGCEARGNKRAIDRNANSSRAAYWRASATACLIGGLQRWGGHFQGAE